MPKNGMAVVCVCVHIYICIYVYTYGLGVFPGYHSGSDFGFRSSCLDILLVADDQGKFSGGGIPVPCKRVRGVYIYIYTLTDIQGLGSSGLSRYQAGQLGCSSATHQ